MTSTPEVVECLIKNGARLTARLVDGRTALHIAATRGNAEMVAALMDKSLENEEEEDEKNEARKKAKRAERASKKDTEEEDSHMDDASSEASEITLNSEDDEDDEDDEDEEDDMTMGSFVKVELEKTVEVKASMLLFHNPQRHLRQLISKFRMASPKTRSIALMSMTLMSLLGIPDSLLFILPFSMGI